MGLTKSSQSTLMNAQSISDSSNSTSSGIDVSSSVAVAFDVLLDYSTNPTEGDVTITVFESQDGTNYSDEAVETVVVSPTADRRVTFQMDCIAFKKLCVNVANESGQTATTTIKAITVSI